VNDDMERRVIGERKLRINKKPEREKSNLKRDFHQNKLKKYNVFN
jgi:hypothetical protein